MIWNPKCTTQHAIKVSDNQRCPVFMSILPEVLSVYMSKYRYISPFLTRMAACFLFSHSIYQVILYISAYRVYVCFNFFFFFFFWSFQGCTTHSIWRFPDQGWNWSCSCQPTPQPYSIALRHQIQAASATYTQLMATPNS